MSNDILIVDDSLTVRMDLSEAFEAAGLPHAAVASLGEARARLARSPAALLVLDVVLPDGDGIGFLRELRDGAATRELIVLLLSSEAEVRDRIHGLRTGADDYVGKPYDASLVVQRARELLARRGAVVTRRTRLLVVDDSQTYRELLREVLEQHGYQVQAAASGEEGLRLAASVRPDAILVDGMMPGVDGLTFIRRLRTDAALRDTPCLLLTAADDRAYELRALDAGADAFVCKDVQLDVVLARVAALLRASEAGPRAVASLSGARVLVVDDDLGYRGELAELLRAEGYDVVVAGSGEEGLALLAAQAVDCLLLDDQLPGLSGRETCQRVRANPATAELPLVMLSASPARDGLLDGLGAGADDFVLKSSDVDVLRARVRAQIRRKHVEDEHRRVREALLRRELEAREARSARTLAEVRAAAADELARKNRELEAFSYSVSHDLRAPLRAIDGFAAALAEELGDDLAAPAREHLGRVRAGARRMGELIDDLLALSRIGRGELRVAELDLSRLAREVSDELARRDPARHVSWVIAASLRVSADERLVRVLLENLLGNAWKFTAGTPEPRVEVGVRPGGEADPVFFVRDNGAGFDMRHADKLFKPFQRLHSEREFPGTGIGLATVYRVVERHGGRVWAEGAVGAGATVYFTLPAPRVG